MADFAPAGRACRPRGGRHDVRLQAALLFCAAGLASALSTSAAAARPRVTVVGAGVAGLCCARTLCASGVDVRVLERADDVGGRVRSDLLDGFILDRGFQVFLTEYPEPRSVLDYDELKLRPFLPGALVQIGGVRHLVADPLRRPQDLIRGVVAPIGSLLDKVAVALFAAKQFVQPAEAILAKPPRSTLSLLKDELGVSDVIISRFFRPFYQGIFLSPLEEQDARMFEFVLKMFTLGVAALPAKGLGEVAQQLARKLPTGTVQTRMAALAVTPTSVKVARVDESGVTQADSAEILQCDAVVIAVERPALAAIGGAEGSVGTERGCASTALYFAIDGPPPVSEPILVLNGDVGPALQPGPPVVNNICFPSSISPSYAPSGKSLASVTVVGDPEVDDAQLEAAVRTQLAGWFGESVHTWRFLRIYRVPYAQPSQSGACVPFQQSTRLASGLYRCGDHTSAPTLNGAMESGRLAAEAVLEDLRARGIGA
mmetsp:Transcript_43576/g.100777  ORF Transcript_43576/g.100777 Transcript_43576/m.100777 type:complete len:486 (+) Transcript_43576:45-1502(+)